MLFPWNEEKKLIECLLLQDVRPAILGSLLFAGIKCKGTLTDKNKPPLSALDLFEKFNLLKGQMIHFECDVKDSSCFWEERLALYHLLTLQ